MVLTHIPIVRRLNNVFFCPSRFKNSSFNKPETEPAKITFTSMVYIAQHFTFL